MVYATSFVAISYVLTYILSLYFYFIFFFLSFIFFSIFFCSSIGILFLLKGLVMKNVWYKEEYEYGKGLIERIIIVNVPKKKKI